LSEALPPLPWTVARPQSPWAPLEPSVRSPHPSFRYLLVALRMTLRPIELLLPIGRASVPLVASQRRRTISDRLPPRPSARRDHDTLPHRSPSLPMTELWPTVTQSRPARHYANPSAAPGLSRYSSAGPHKPRRPMSMAPAMFFSLRELQAKWLLVPKTVDVIYPSAPFHASSSVPRLLEGSTRATRAPFRLAPAWPAGRWPSALHDPRPP